ncbi:MULTISPECIES: RNA polymerase sigma factor [Bacillus]|uniref:RNA polymerase subunit sigma n=1 Tax=Bacillus pseudomycoides TaxID=64104 RepID=A0ABD6TAD3_9BACI|nr:RNA polymerase sigma factor [Bacillus pseudomycoides]MDR4185893.1 RNA polymerase sigma factor [Bacillus pseudomycoides]PDZ71930.1 RNA polymerase subunit sigma [Bacillus pseudomycoides]PEF23234.1 RNA polymerase subunit sigma [Bacillus pseudomycoides]PEJ27510.1 RNA polymerase subunit sigma [Bacillus pseudomycoides]PEK39569.1 RNA polymerase subunit sigma [Bacillus pseudomycoides]
MLVQTYRHYIFQVIFAILRHEEDAQDITQEVFVKIHASLPNYQFRGLKTWMARIATNHAIDYKRKKEREKVELSLSNETQEDIKSSHNIEASLLRKEQKLLIAQKLRELPENYRDVVLAHYLEEKSYQEIAAQQNAEVKTVEMKLYRARKWIKKHWKEEDFL